MSTLTLRSRRDPFAEFDALVRAAFGPAFTRPEGFSPAAEVTRDGEDALVHVELPGVDAEHDVTVEVVRGTLVVRGERRDSRSDERDGRSLREVRYGAFRRAFALPPHVTGDDVTATYDAGILTVRVARAYAGATAHRVAVTAAPGTSAAPARSESEPTPAGSEPAGDAAGEAHAA
jgi:HSP20 family protein